MKILHYYGMELDVEKTKNGEFPYYNVGLFSYTLKGGENEVVIRKEIEFRCIKNSGGYTIQVPDRFQIIPIEDFEKGNYKIKHHEVKTFYWLNQS